MNPRQRFALSATALLLAATAVLPAGAQGASAGAGAERVSGSLDLVLLLDKSLSMAPFFDETKAYVAGEVLGPILAPGDRLIIELVYGKVQRLFAGTIAGEADKAAAIRALRGVAADGRFTDLGAALDAAKRDVDELGGPERPKYVLLVTDERQEAPDGSPYRAPDYRLKHPSLEYVRRVDLGHFRAISVGLLVGAKVAAAAPDVVRYLSEPPESRGAAKVEALPGAQASAPAGAQASPGARKAGAFSPGAILAGVAAVAVIALAAALVVPLQSKKKRKDEERRGE